jgi:hypothetical protein
VIYSKCTSNLKKYIFFKSHRVEMSPVIESLKLVLLLKTIVMYSKYYILKTLALLFFFFFFFANSSKPVSFFVK